MAIFVPTCDHKTVTMNVMYAAVSRVKRVRKKLKMEGWM